MSQTFFSKLDPSEIVSRLSLLGTSKGWVTLWEKGKKDKFKYQVSGFIKDRLEISLETREDTFKNGQTVLCTFELRGMNFFSEVIVQKSISGYIVLVFKSPVFKSERRSSYRLLAYPVYKIWAEFDLGQTYEGGKVIDLKTKSSQTQLFKNFLKIIDNNNENERLKILIQDLSVSGMALNVSGVEASFFKKGVVFHNVTLRFSDEVFEVPEAKIVYVVDFVSHDKNTKKYKLGVHFENFPSNLEDKLSKKINDLLRETDSNKEFEKFLK